MLLPTVFAVAVLGWSIEPPLADPPAAEGRVVAPPETPAAPRLVGKPGDGATIDFGRAFSLNVRSRIQVRYQLEIPADQRQLEQVVNISTARLWFSGHALHPSITYMLQLAVAARDFRDGARSPIYDAYLDWRAHRDVSVRVGQFFVPFDHLRTVREWALQMANRPIPVGELTLDRDVGLVLYSNNFLGDASPVAWRVGAFGGGGTNLTVGRKPGALVVARLELRPLGRVDDDVEGDLERRRSPALALGVGGAANFNTDRLRSTTGATFTGGTATYYHAAADLVFKVRGFAAQGEYLLKEADRDTITSTDDDGIELVEYTRSAQGWVAQASYLFDPPLEVVARLAAIYPFDDTDPTMVADTREQGQEVGAGLNYYVNGHKFKVQLDWIALMPRDFTFGSAHHAVHAQLDVTF